MLFPGRWKSWDSKKEGKKPKNLLIPGDGHGIILEQNTHSLPLGRISVSEINGRLEEKPRRFSKWQ